MVRYSRKSKSQRRMSSKSRRSRRSQSKRVRRSSRGGGCHAPVDVSRYSQACSSTNQLPLDRIFQQNFQDWQTPPDVSNAPQKGGRRKTHRKLNKKRSRKTRRTQKRGGGFSVLPDVNIGNRPEYRGYADHAPPVFTKDGAIWSNNFQPLCGQAGGNKHRVRKQRKQRKNSKRRTRARRGGGVVGMSGVDGNFSADMSTRKFDCNQPYWEPSCT